MKRILAAAGAMLMTATLGLFAQPTALGSLTPAPWFDPSRGSLRGILGWGGSARVTEGAIAGLTAGSVAPLGKNALVRIDGRWNWADLSGESPVLDVLDDIPETVDSIDWSAGGRCAVLIVGRERARRVCREADGTRTEVAMRVEGAERAAVSRTGRWLAIAARAGDEAELWIADAATQEVRPVFGVCPASMTFTAKSDALFLVDCRTGELLEVDPAATAPVSLGMADSEGVASHILETLDSDVLALVRPDGRTAALVSRRRRAMIGDFWFHERVSGFQRLSDGVYLAFPKEPGGLLQLIDFGRDEKVFFVPAAD